MTLHPVILAGGSGTRLWPLSREYYPKPFLSFGSERSMLQETILRLDGIEDISPPIIVCNEEHRFLVAEHTRQIGKSLSSIVLEPEGRNTAPALTLAAQLLADESRGSRADDPVMLVMPADNVVRDTAAFHSAARSAVPLAQSGCLVTFGIAPTSPKTDYGYINKGKPFEGQGSADRGGRDISDPSTEVPPFHVSAFVEKPDSATAQEMVQSGDHLWNSGMFIMRVSVWLEQIGRYRPDIAEVCRAAHGKGRRDGDFWRPDPGLFANCPSDSVDYAVMEKAAGAQTRPESGPLAECVVLPLDAGWSDVGAWSALWEDGDLDGDGNLVRGDVYAQSTSNSLLIGQRRLLATVGVDNIIVVETPDAVLVADKDSVQDVKELVAQLKADGRPEHENHRNVHRPWGTYETVDMGSRFQVKRLTVNPGAALSFQMHHHRAEHWVVVTGTAKVTKGDEEYVLTENQSTYVPVGVKHRLENPGTVPLEIIEVSSGSYLGEDDIVRFDDRYNRHTNG